LGKSFGGNALDVLRCGLRYALNFGLSGLYLYTFSLSLFRPLLGPLFSRM